MMMDLHKLADLLTDRPVRQALGKIMQELDQLSPSLGCSLFLISALLADAGTGGRALPDVVDDVRVLVPPADLEAFDAKLEASGYPTGRAREARRPERARRMCPSGGSAARSAIRVGVRTAWRFSSAPDRSARSRPSSSSGSCDACLPPAQTFGAVESPNRTRKADPPPIAQ